MVLLKNQNKEIKLAVLNLENGKSETIFNGIKNVINEFDLWKSIKMIISDTTSVNTGKRGGVVALLQQQFKKKQLKIPQFIGCQHHILDLVLKHVMDECLTGQTSSPNISYSLTDQMISDYESLQNSFQHNNKILKLQNIKWRDDEVSL